MTIEEINALDIESASYDLRFRILSNRGVVLSSPSSIDDFTFTDEELQEELILYKAQLRSIEEARLANEIIVKDIKDRLSKIDLPMAMFELEMEEPNSALVAKRVTNDMDLELLAQLEAAEISFKSKDSIAQAEHATKKQTALDKLAALGLSKEDIQLILE